MARSFVNVAKPGKRRRYRLEDLIAGIGKENYYREVDWGGPRGNEAW